ncbi:MAG: GH92 family glycosyl hydrolase [Bacteroidetes bacterium]|nr:GH92 family glycosyl hydrolase [Bacteroidota bacterium]
MKNFFLTLLLVTSLLYSQQNLIEYVDPFIGTSEHGHTYPGAVLPFGMVQLSPDTGVEDWDWCSGYHSSDSSIMGFSHTHLSGTGCADLGDILLMPVTGAVKFEPGSKNNPDEGYRSRFSHSKECAEPGYYSVELDDYDISAELTATERVGLHKYTYNKSNNAAIIIDLAHGIGDGNKESFLKIINNNKIVGYRFSKGWAKDQKIFFTAEFSRPIIEHMFNLNGTSDNKFNEIKGERVKASLKFDLDETNILIVKVAISHVDIKGANENMNKELPGWNFEEIRNSAKMKWNDELNKIIVEGGSEEQRKIFYTALYHTMIVPNIFEDVDGRYRGMDGQIYTSEDHTHYSVFSLWDTFRSTHPLYTLIDQKRTNDFIKSLYHKSIQQNNLPVWELLGNETGTMIGYHSVPVIVDAFMKNIVDYDVKALYNEIKNTSMKDHLGLDYYKKLRYIPMDKEEDASSKTLEYAYDDWCIAQMAKVLGEMDDYKYYLNRASNYRNVFDNKTKFSRGRYSDGRWKTNFIPEEPFPLGSGEFTEGSSWQYTWFVPQDIFTLINLMGGDNSFSIKLDSLFIASSNSNFQMPSDVTGLIGQYAHGNEPSHHVSYLYNYSGKAYKTQEKVRQILDEMYTDKRDGLCGNEDCGQMSSWYIFSSIGFYPVTPGSNEYVFGSPIFDKVTINFENGNKFVLNTKNNSKKNKYLKRIQLNDTEYNKLYLRHEELIKGGEITFEMSDTPNYKLGLKMEDRPNSSLKNKFTAIEENYMFSPYQTTDRTIFNNSLSVDLKCTNINSEIYYTLDGSLPDTNSIKFDKPIVLNESGKIYAVSYRKDLGYSEIFNRDYLRAIYYNQAEPFFTEEGEVYPKIKIDEKYSPNYSAGGDNGLIDGIKGTSNFHDGKWQGYRIVDLNALIDLGVETEIKQIKISFLKDHGSWIFFPEKLTCSISIDKNNFEKLPSITIGNKEDAGKKEIKEFSIPVYAKTRYLNILAQNMGLCPSWHSAAGKNAFIFVDEIVLER